MPRAPRRDWRGVTERNGRVVQLRLRDGLEGEGVIVW